jgi:hypothetical protein
MSDQAPKKKKGKRPKTGGRTKGTPNKASLHIRAELAAADINLAREYVAAARDIVDPKERVAAFLQLFRYVYPALREIDGPVEIPEQSPPPAAPAAAAARPLTALERIALIRGQDPGKPAASG